MFITEDELEMVRKSIIPEKKLILKDKIELLHEKKINTINCYAYALGIMASANENGWYEPGFTENKLYEDKEDFTYKIKMDLINLDFGFRYIPLGETKSLHKGEYLIKAFFGDDNFHFIRKSTQNGRWFHKVGWCNQPEYCQTDISYLNPYDKYYAKYCIPGYLEPTGFTDEKEDEQLIPVGYFAIQVK